MIYEHDQYPLEVKQFEFCKFDNYGNVFKEHKRLYTQYFMIYSSYSTQAVK